MRAKLGCAHRRDSGSVSCLSLSILLKPRGKQGLPLVPPIHADRDGGYQARIFRTAVGPRNVLRGSSCNRSGTTRTAETATGLEPRPAKPCHFHRLPTILNKSLAEVIRRWWQRAQSSRLTRKGPSPCNPQSTKTSCYQMCVQQAAALSPRCYPRLQTS
jgi:hypothetical protein